MVMTTIRLPRTAILASSHRVGEVSWLSKSTAWRVADEDSCGEGVREPGLVVVVGPAGIGNEAVVYVHAHQRHRDVGRAGSDAATGGPDPFDDQLGAEPVAPRAFCLRGRD